MPYWRVTFRNLGSLSALRNASSSRLTTAGFMPAGPITPNGEFDQTG
jgi:hypothetical protein